MAEFTCEPLDNLDNFSNSTLCGHLQAFKYLFNASNKISKKDSINNENYYLAHNAAATGNLNLLKWTFKNTKSKVTDQDPEGLTILHVACLTANLNIVEWVIQFTHLSPVTRTEEGATALHFCCCSGNFQITKLLIEAEPRLINMRMANGATAAMFATQRGYIDIMEFLLNEGANFGLPTKNGVNCLHMAAQQGHIDAVKWLVENTGLRLNGKDDNGVTPIHYAAVHNHHEIVSWLLEKEVRLLKERFMIGYQNPTFINESSEAIEYLINSENSLSIKKICDFSALESVQEKLTLILSQYNQNSLIKKKETENNGIVQCSIPISVLLLLQSALVDLRSQYQKILRQSYLSIKLSDHNQISEETQTVESYERSGSHIRHIADNNSPGYKEIPRPSISEQRFDSIPPPPPLISPPQFIPSVSDSPMTFTNVATLRHKTNRKYINHRRGSSSEDIKISLIQELKKINTLRSKNNPLNNYPEDTESASNTDSSSLNDSNSLSAKIKTRNYITDSAPNLTLIFNSNGSGNSSSVMPKWKTDLVAKQTSNKQKDDDNLKQTNETPVWKRQLIESKGINPNKSRKHSGSSNMSTVETDELGSPRISKVTQLVNQWQNNAT